MAMAIATPASKRYARGLRSGLDIFVDPTTRAARPFNAVAAVYAVSASMPVSLLFKGLRRSSCSAEEGRPTPSLQAEAWRAGEHGLALSPAAVLTLRLCTSGAATCGALPSRHAG